MQEQGNVIKRSKKVKNLSHNVYRKNPKNVGHRIQKPEQDGLSGISWGKLEFTQEEARQEKEDLCSRKGGLVLDSLHILLFDFFKTLFFLLLTQGSYEHSCNCYLEVCVATQSTLYELL